MNQPLPPDAPADTPPEQGRSKAVRALRGCGWTLGVGGLVLGILITGGFEGAAWGSALIAILIGWLVYNLSGSNGFWES